MASLPQLPLKEVKLPKSGITCKIGMNYGDKVAINQALMGDIKFETVRNAESNKTETEMKREVSMDTIRKSEEEYLTRCVKEWDVENTPITLDAIYGLEKEDGEFLLAEVKKLDQADLSKEDKKK